MVVLVTGSGGQLGQSLQYIAKDFAGIRFHFCSSSQLDITDAKAVSDTFEKIRPDYCINAAAYTAVDKSESEPERAYAVNVTGVKNLAIACAEYSVTLVHISTDFVFDGNKTSPYTELDQTNPQGVYGSTKLEGEQLLAQIHDQYFIVRTSWVYSQFGNNFMKTMLRLSGERETVSVVNDQRGTPTHAVDLAHAVVRIVLSGSKNYGIYNFSNEGVASWYDFAKKIFELNTITTTLLPIPTSAFPTPAKRPAYSVLDKTKIKTEFGLLIDRWDTALEKHH